MHLLLAPIVLGEQLGEELLPHLFLVLVHVELVLEPLARRVCLVGELVSVVVEDVDRLSTDFTVRLLQFRQAR